MERGIGICSQHAIALTDYLTKKGIATSVVSLNGHVVAEVKLKNADKLILDPDYDVAIPLSLSKIEASPLMVKSYYEGKLGKNSDETVEKIASLYSKAENVVWPNGASGYIDRSPNKVLFEKLGYIAIWIIPFIFILPPLLFLKKYRKACYGKGLN